MSILFTEDNYLSRKIGKRLTKKKREFKIASETNEVLDHILNNILEGNSSELIFLFDNPGKSRGNELLSKIRNLEKNNKIEPAETNLIVLLTTHENRRVYLTKRFNECDYIYVLPADRKKLSILLEAAKRSSYQTFPKSA